MTQKTGICFCLTLTLAVSLNVVRADVITNFGRVLFVGDSITEGSASQADGDGNYSWRYSLWQNMIDAKASFDFVGSRNANYAGTTIYPSYSGLDFENRHEAIWGTTSLERSESLETHYSDLNRDGSNFAADTAFIMIGSNDVFASRPAEEIASNIQHIMDGLQSANDSVSVYLISVPPVFLVDTDGDGFRDAPWLGNPQLELLNDRLSALVVAERTLNSRVVFIDVASSLKTEHFYDGIHPNGSGEKLIGDVVFASSSAAVPEPTSVLLLVFVLITFAGFRWFRSAKKQWRVGQSAKDLI